MIQFADNQLNALKINAAFKIPEKEQSVLKSNVT